MADALAHLQKLQVVIDGFLVFFDVIVEYSDRVVRPAFISHLSCPPASEGKHFIILQSAHNCHQGAVIDLFSLRFLLIECTAEQRSFFDDPGRSIEKKWEFDTMRLRGCHRLVVALAVELPHLVLLGKRPTDAEGSVDRRNVTAVTSLSALHNKNISRMRPIKLFGFGCCRFVCLKNIQMQRQVPEDDPIGHLTSPIVTGGAIIALKCREGVIIATDTLLSYGGLLKYHGVNRYEVISDKLVITATGQFADFQEATRQLKELTRESDLYDDGVNYSVQEYANYLAALGYERRNKQNPFYNNFVVAGFENGQAFLSSIDLYGTHIRKDYVCAGFSKYFGLALVAKYWSADKTMEECKKIIHQCWSVLYQRDCHTVDQLQFATVTQRGVEILAPEKVASNWDFKEFKERKNQKLWQ